MDDQIRPAGKAFDDVSTGDHDVFQYGLTNITEEQDFQSVFEVNQEMVQLWGNSPKVLSESFTVAYFHSNLKDIVS